jgi:hypothetical protein
MKLGIGLGITYPNGITYSPASLFAAGEPGVWYDPSDMSTLFQDAAGTTPVTAVEQPVGLMLDKSGRGNHASQATTTARPLLSARYNILTDTAFTSTAEWGLSNWLFSGGEADPFGGAAAAKVQMGDGAAQAPARVIGPVAGDVVFRVWWKAGNQASVFLAARDDTTATLLGTVRCDTGAVTGTVTGSIIRQQNGFNLVELRTVAFPPGNTLRIYLGGTGGVAAGTHSFWYGPDLRLVCDVDKGPTYQYVAPAAASYEAAGFSRYLRFDGTDDWMSTGNIDFSGTSNMSIVAGVRKLNDLAPFYQLVAELGPGNSNGSFSLWYPYSDTHHSRVIFKGDNASSHTVIVSDVPGARTDVLTATAELGAYRIKYKVSGTQYPDYVGAADPGKFGNLPLYLFSRAGISSRFRGTFYGLIVVGRLLNAGELASAHEFMRNKSRAY